MPCSRDREYRRSRSGIRQPIPRPPNGARHRSGRFEILARQFAVIHGYFWFSPRQAMIGGFGISLPTGLVNAIGDATNQYGFSYEDPVMDILGAGTAVLTDATDTRDLSGFRVGPLFVDAPPKEQDGMGHDYTHEIYTADLQLGWSFQASRPAAVDDAFSSSARTAPPEPGPASGAPSVNALA